ncbi:MAG: phage tail protein I [Pseudomonadota bacterium]|nr:phage tail protein I [Pseudomonadota bacterium]
MTYSLLPENASSLERAFERAFLDLLGEIEAPFPGLLDPQQTPAEFLPYLANDRGVAEWESAAADNQKRKTVAAAWPMQRLAGTREALDRAIRLANFDAVFYPWHETGGAPFTLEIRATSDVNQTPDDYRRLVPRIADAKAERDTITIRVEKTIPIQQRLLLAQVSQHAHQAQIAPAPIDPISALATQLVIGGATHQSHQHRIIPAPIDPLAVLPAQLSVTSVMQSARRWTLQHPIIFTADTTQHLAAGVIRAATIMTVEEPIHG